MQPDVFECCDLVQIPFHHIWDVWKGLNISNNLSSLFGRVSPLCCSSYCCCGCQISSNKSCSSCANSSLHAVQSTLHIAHFTLLIMAARLQTGGAYDTLKKLPDLVQKCINQYTHGCVQGTFKTLSSLKRIPCFSGYTLLDRC